MTFPKKSRLFLTPRLGVLCALCITAVVVWGEMTVAAPQSHVNPFENRGAVAPSIQALASADDGTIYAGSFGMGVFVSHDHGETWTPMNEGLSGKFVLSLAVNQKGVVYAGTVRGGIFRTKEDGSTWELINQGLKRVEVKSLLAHPQGVYAGTGRGVYQWHETDHTWVVVAKGLDQTLVSSLVMMENQQLFAGTAGQGVQWLDTTKPGTAAWQPVKTQFVDPKEQLRHNHIRVLTKNPDEALFVGTQNGGIYHSADNGKSWHTYGRSLPNDSIRGIISTSAGVFVATGRGIYTTSQRTAKWTSVNTGLTEQAIQAMAIASNGDLFAGTSAGAFRSRDRGEHWENVSEGFGTQFSMPRPYF